MSQHLSQSPQSVNPTELLQVISDASAQDQGRVRRATSRLQELLQLFGTYEALQEIAIQKNIPITLRQQAIIQFKNSALNYWKSRKLLSDEHRARIRTRSLMFISEEDDLIAQINEVIVARIARSDYPGLWPNLISDLMGVIDTNLQSRYIGFSSDAQTILVLRRSLNILNAILKEYASVRMLGGIRAMGEIAKNLHLVIYDYYSKISSAFAEISPSTVSSRMADDIMLGHLVFKVLVKIATWLWSKTDRMSQEESLSTHAWLEGLFRNSAVQLKALVESRINLLLALRASGLQLDTETRRCVDGLTRHIRLFGNFFRRLQVLSVRRFVLLPSCGDLVLYYWDKVVQATDGPSEFIAEAAEAVFPVHFLVQALVLFKDNLAQWSPTRKTGAPDEQTLSKEFVEGAVLRLVTRFIPLGLSDLDAWIAEPEEWLSMEDNDNDQWEYHLRPCGERVLLTLALRYTQYVVPILHAKLNEISVQLTLDLSSVLQKEAIYCAIGRCAPLMKEVIPFQHWIESMLLPEARDTNPNSPIIKRRIAWVVGKWVSGMCCHADNPKIWEVLSILLHERGPGTDAVVRLTAATALRECIDTIEFNPEVFAPFLQDAVTDLVQILAESEAFESKRRIAKCLIVLIQRAGTKIVPFISTIIEPIPKLWNTAGTSPANTDWLLKSSLLTVITTLIESAKEASMSLVAIVVPLVFEGLSPGTLVHLDSDALVLWRAALRNTTSVDNLQGAPRLLDLFPLAVNLLSENLDLLGKIISIHESYFLLDAPQILQGFGLSLFSAFRQALQSPAVLDLNSKDMLIAVESLLELAPSSLWAEALDTSGLFSHIIDTFVTDKKSTMVLTAYVHVLARIAIVDAQTFLYLVTLSAQKLGQQETYLYDVLLDQWWTRFDNMSEPRHRKLAAMGIAALVATGRPEVLVRLPTEIFNLWMDVFSEIKESLITQENGSGSGVGLVRHWEQDDPPHSYFDGTEEGTPEYTRRKLVYEVDPVRTTQLSAYVRAQLSAAESVCGTQQFQSSYLSRADPLVLAQIQVELRR